jgi:membrane protease YdiL (CAAX protease family)
VLLLAALGGAVAIRVGLAGVEGARSASAGAVFGVLVLVASCLGGWRPSLLRRRDLLSGLGGAAAVIVFPLVHHLVAPGDSLGVPSDRWLAIVVCVAVAEESLLRGALWDVVARSHGELTALAVTTAAFALMHVPLYGIRVIPLDLAVGALLGGLRLWSGAATAPAIAHVAADLTGWWLR